MGEERHIVKRWQKVLKIIYAEQGVGVDATAQIPGIHRPRSMRQAYHILLS